MQTTSTGMSELSQVASLSQRLDVAMIDTFWMMGWLGLAGISEILAFNHVLPMLGLVLNQLIVGGSLGLGFLKGRKIFAVVREALDCCQADINKKDYTE